MPDFKYLILGGGMVAGYAAKELVERGLGRGELAIVSSDDTLPYERPPLSKDFLAGKTSESDVLINPPAFYEAAGITVKLGTVVDRVNTAERKLHTADGQEFGFEKLLIATGARVRTLDVPGGDLPGILYLRSLGDSRRLRTAYAGAKRAVVIGGGFIGMEVASVLAQQDIETTMVFPDDRVWANFFTPPMSAFFERYYEQRGVTFVRGEAVTAFAGNDRIEAATTGTGRNLPADLVLTGIGVLPVTELLDGSGIACDKGVVVNEYLETNVTGIWAAGDVARYRDVVFEKDRRVEHWDNAVEQGKHAAGLLLGERSPFVHVPYFFSDVFDLSYEFWGDTTGADDVLYRGDVTSSSFSAWWLRDGVLVAAFIMNRPDDERDAAPGWIQEHRHVERDRLLAEPALA